MIILKNKKIQYNQPKALYPKMLHLKQEMKGLADSFGITHELTVLKSQELDLILNQYMK